MVRQRQDHVRAGYGVSYTGGGNGIVYDYTVKGAPGVNDDGRDVVSYLNLANIKRFSVAYRSSRLIYGP